MTVITFDELVSQYQKGRREFRLAELTGHASDIDLSGIDLSGARLEKIFLSSVILRNANLSRTRITGMIRYVDLTGSDLSESEIAVHAGSCYFEGVSLRSAKLGGASLFKGCFRPTTLQGANLRSAKFHDVDLRGADLSNVDCSEAAFIDCDLSDAKLTSTIFHEAHLSGSCLKHAHLERANFYKAYLRAADLSGSLCQEADFRRTELTLAQFTRAHLEKSDFGAAVMTQANLKAADLTGASLRQVDLTHVVATNANFSEADLTGATLQYAAAIGANFTGATLVRTNFQRSLLSGANFHSASTTGAFFWDAELEGGALSKEQLEVTSTTGKLLPDFGGRVLYSDDSDRRVTHTIVRIYFATDRSRLTYEDQTISFGDARNEDRDSPLELGTCDVSVPRDHRMGKLEAPSIWRLEINWNIDKHVVLRKIQPVGAKVFWQAVSEHIQTTEGKELLLFVHGFNVSFEDAVRRCAQISYDLAFDGAPIVFSWPSKATITGYLADEASVEWSADHLCSFMQKLLDLPGVSSLHILAHSMGNRAVMRAMERLGPTAREDQRVLAHVALTAPDIDAGVFFQVAPNMIPRAGKITLYASDNDRALKVSQEFRAYRRAGQAGDNILVLPGIDTIDVTALDTDFLGHSYYGDNRSVISDIFYLIRGSAPKGRHGLREAVANSLPYWRFQP